MITKKQFEFLKWYKTACNPSPSKMRFMARIQKRIDQSLDTELELAKNYPEILLGETCKSAEKTHERLQKLLLVIKLLKPTMDVYLEHAKSIEEVMKIID